MILHLHYLETCWHFVISFYQTYSIRINKSVHQGCLFLTQYVTTTINAIYINQQLESIILKWKGL